MIIDACVFIAAYHKPDLHHAQSIEFLQQTFRTGIDQDAPSFLITEVAGSIARLTGSTALAQKSKLMIQSITTLKLHPVTLDLAANAAMVAAQSFLRGADAVYVALAQQINSPLITMDNEILKRAAGAVEVFTPQQWLKSKK